MPAMMQTVLQGTAEKSYLLPTLARKIK